MSQNHRNMHKNAVDRVIIRKAFGKYRDRHQYLNAQKELVKSLAYKVIKKFKSCCTAIDNSKRKRKLEQQAFDKVYIAFIKSVIVKSRKITENLESQLAKGS